MKCGVKNHDQQKVEILSENKTKCSIFFLGTEKKKKRGGGGGGGEYQNKNKIQKLFNNVQQTVQQYHDHKSDNS